MVASFAEHRLAADSADFVPKRGERQDKSCNQERPRTAKNVLLDFTIPRFDCSDKAANEMMAAALAVNIPIVLR
jgi:hypothetical protein